MQILWWIYCPRINFALFFFFIVCAFTSCTKKVIYRQIVKDGEYQLSILHLYVKLPEHRHRLVVVVAVNSVVMSSGSVRF